MTRVASSASTSKTLDAPPGAAPAAVAPVPDAGPAADAAAAPPARAAPPATPTAAAPVRPRGRLRGSARRGAGRRNLGSRPATGSAVGSAGRPGTSGCSSVSEVSKAPSAASGPSAAAASVTSRHPGRRGLLRDDGGGTGDRAAHDLARGPRRHLAGEVTGAGRALVVVEGEAADGVEVAGHARGDLGRGGHATGHPGGGGQPGPTGAERPQAGEARVGQGHDTDGVAAGGVLGLGAVLAGAHRGGLEATQAHVAVGGAQHVVGLEVEVVHAALAGGLQGGRDLTGDAAHLVAGHPAVGDQLGEGAGLAEVLLDDEGDALVAADVEDADEHPVGDRGGAAGAVEQGGRAVVVSRRCTAVDTVRPRVVSSADQRSVSCSCSSRRRTV